MFYVESRHRRDFGDFRLEVLNGGVVWERDGALAFGASYPDSHGEDSGLWPRRRLQLFI